MTTGLIQVYTGDGKGKTTASLGLALRAIGQGYKVHMIQFMKGGSYTGEYISAHNYLPNFSIAQFGRPCIKQTRQIKLKGYVIEKTDQQKNFDVVREQIECGTCRYCFLNDAIQKDYVEQGLQHAHDIIKNKEYRLIILDEINVALSLGFLTVAQVINLLEKKHQHQEIILTGRGVPQEIINYADLVTEMKLHKHYFDKGVQARRGIEY